MTIESIPIECDDDIKHQFDFHHVLTPSSAIEVFFPYGPNPNEIWKLDD